ncbi:MAG: class I tRNA ligase family protein, partial [Nanoarchaeota archaeon]|nr:class I tRNA ligase family protein [Nanoarchaeota archaeon]
VFPASLLGSGDPYTMLYRISSTEYLNYEEGKFSKSRGIGVFGTDAIETGIPSDVFRYYLLVNRPERSDSSFHWKDLQDKTNNELAANIGNLVNRAIVFLKKFFDQKIPLPQLTEADKSFIEMIKKEESKVTEYLQEVEIKEALKQIMHIAKLGNQYFQESEPWKKMKQDPEAAGTALYVLANLVSDLAVMLQPYLPDTSAKIFNQLNIEPLAWDALGAFPIKQGHGIGEPEILFQIIEDNIIDELQARFSAAKEPEKFLLNLKAAKIIKAKEHPDADKLVILKIDLGTEQRQIVAGIRKFYSPDELPGRNIVVVTNLKPAKLRGQESNGMLLAASDKSGKNCVLVDAAGCEAGEELSVEGMGNNKEKIDFNQFLKVKFSVRNKKLLADGKLLDTKSGKIAVDAENGWSVK